MTKTREMPADVTDFLHSCGVPQPLPDIQPLIDFYEDLQRANQTTNLTRITDWSDFCIRHVADSLSVLRRLPRLGQAETGLRVADVGCGGGFPMIPLLWVCPERTVVGVESRPRKAEFVAREIASLGFPNARCLAARSRELGRDDAWRGTFDVVLLRAVSTAANNLRESRHLLGAGHIVCYKTPKAVENEWDEADREARKHGFDLTAPPPFDLPAQAGPRQFIIFHRSRGNQDRAGSS